MATAIQKLDIKTRAFLMEAVYEALHDPDFGLELTDYMKRKLGRLSRSKSKTIPWDKIKKKYLLR